MASRAKIAISLAPEVLDLVDRHAAGRSRSRCIEQELLSALRAREWERLSSELDPVEAEDQLAWAQTGFAAAHDSLARSERPTGRASKRKRAR